MKARVLVDTGPLVAFLDRRERHHAWVVEQSKRTALPWLTCEPVLAEAWHLLRKLPAGRDALLTMLARRAVQVSFSLASEIGAVQPLTRRYRDLPMSLADACLVRMAELAPGHLLFTLDSDFAIYRADGDRPLALLAPFTH